MRKILAAWLSFVLFLTGLLCVAQAQCIGCGIWGVGKPASSSHVAIQDTGTAGGGSGSITHLNYANLSTVTSVANEVLLGALALDNKAATGLTAIWDAGATNQPMTLLVSEAGPSGATVGLVAIFGLKAPTPGTGQTLQFSWTGTAGAAVACAATMKNVNQTVPFPNTASSNAGVSSSSTSSVAVTSQTNDLVFGAAVAGDDTSVLMTSLSGTPICRSNTFIPFGTNYDNGTASVTLTSIFTANNFWSAVGVDVAHL